MFADAIIEAQAQPMEVDEVPPRVTSLAEFEEQYDNLSPAFDLLLEKIQAASGALASLNAPQSAH